MLALLWVLGIWVMSMITIKLLKDWFGGSKNKGK